MNQIREKLKWAVDAHPDDLLGKPTWFLRLVRRQTRNRKVYSFLLKELRYRKKNDVLDEKAGNMEKLFFNLGKRKKDLELKSTARQLILVTRDNLSEIHDRFILDFTETAFSLGMFEEYEKLVDEMDRRFGVGRLW